MLSTKPETIGDIMTRDVYCLRTIQTIEEVVHEFDRREISGAPVVNEEGLVIGLLSRTSILSYLARHHQSPENVLVREVMENVAFSLSEDASLKTAIETMLPGRIHRLIITDAGGHPRGIVTSIDLMDAYYKSIL